MRPVAVLVHVPDIALGLQWYQNAFPEARARPVDEDGFVVLQLESFCIEIVQADDKVSAGMSAGKCGTVLYWWTESVEMQMTHLLGIGATLYRGPMAIEDSQVMCQMQDPFGNLIGLRGGK